ncbi:HdeA/HdeB family chaperone [uncultured Pseudacidovorax sp.]|uniref:HdeA/HdeB family chaperone n=1 Tax=uncultured Pseudacidovorax sp. TaxID=679313 RepID=UPI0025F4D01F|nr:HdeA/HdeB family chaperone [uncultured Pseudacidovorax sp.]
MKVLGYLSALTFTALAGTAAMAQTPPPAAAAPAPVAAAKPAKSITKTTCSDYLALDESVKPKFIYYAVGYNAHGKKEAVFDEVATEKIKPQLDEFCKINLTKSAYKQVMASSMASDPVHGPGPKAK